MSFLYQPYLSSQTESIPIKDSSHSGTPSYKTVSEILTFITTNNYGDSFYLSDTGYSRKGCMIIPIWADEVQDLYLGDNNLQTELGNNYPLWVLTDACHRDSSYKSIGCYNDALVVESTLSGGWNSTLINSRLYHTTGAGNVSGYGQYATLYLAKDYPNIFINEQPLITAITSNGGGATHIAKVTGQLKDLSSNLSDILIVSGGGGGGMLVGETEYAGADAGGISGSGDNSADQTTGYAFGQGENG